MWPRYFLMGFTPSLGFADYSCKCLSLVDLKDTRRFIMQHFLSDITQVDANHCVYTREEENAIVVENVIVNPVILSSILILVIVL